MNHEHFIARRIVFGSGMVNRISAPIVRIAILGVALGIAVMIIALAIVTGFQKEIQDKVVGFGGHIQILKYDENTSLEIKPIDKNQKFLERLKRTEGIKYVQVFATKLGVIKTKEAIEEIVLKGQGTDYNWEFFSDKIVAGKPFTIGDSSKPGKVLVSKYTANRLMLKVGDKFNFYFIEDNEPSKRIFPFKVMGIYETGLEEFDKRVVLCDIKYIQKLNYWNPNQIGGFEVMIDNFSKLDEMGRKVYDMIPYDLKVKTARDISPQIFDWLELQNINVVLIITLMTIVAVINMISALLIIILERTHLIGVLKALGADNWSIRKIFIYIASYLSGFGLLWGNLLGISLCYLQKHFNLIELSQENYYVSVVPINFSFLHLALLNTGTLLVCVLFLIIPTYLITRINPIKAIHYN